MNNNNEKTFWNCLARTRALKALQLEPFFMNHEIRFGKTSGSRLTSLKKIALRLILMTFFLRFRKQEGNVRRGTVKLQN